MHGKRRGFPWRCKCLGNSSWIWPDLRRFNQNEFECENVGVQAHKRSVDIWQSHTNLNPCWPMSQCNVARVRLLATLICSSLFALLPFICVSFVFRRPSHSPFPLTQSCRFFLFHFYSFASVCALILFSSFHLIYPALIPFVYAHIHSHSPYSCHGRFIGFIVVLAYVLLFIAENIPFENMYATWSHRLNRTKQE